jgi:Response regulators consisting of a CheY-like receiver domain and a winged-helix DNA-binding domain
MSNSVRSLASESAPYCRVILATRGEALERRVTGALADEFTAVSVVRTAQEIEALASAPDVVILDAELPDSVSMSALLRIRRRWPALSIIAIGVHSEALASQMLDWGVDDAIEARCSWPHTVARLSAATRRARTVNASLRKRVGDVVYERDTRRVWCGGEEVSFAPRELAVLDCLWGRAGQVVRQESLYDFVWSGEAEGARSNRVEVYISYVRRKLKRSNEVAIETLRGAGYRLVRRAKSDSVAR